VPTYRVGPDEYAIVAGWGEHTGGASDATGFVSNPTGFPMPTPVAERSDAELLADLRDLLSTPERPRKGLTTSMVFHRTLYPPEFLPDLLDD
jgi:hypothetical protein